MKRKKANLMVLVVRVVDVGSEFELAYLVSTTRPRFYNTDVWEQETNSEAARAPQVEKLI